MVFNGQVESTVTFLVIRTMPTTEMVLSVVLSGAYRHCHNCHLSQTCTWNEVTWDTSTTEYSSKPWDCICHLSETLMMVKWMITMMAI